jgi:thiamine-phosphate pyrophosphorylase
LSGYHSRLTLPRFYPILDTDIVAARGLNAVIAAEAILEGGAEILQLRHKTFFSRNVFVQASRIAELCAEARALLVVNDRADVAMMLGAAVHLGQEDLAPADARRVAGPRTPIGFSTHNEQQLRAAAAEPVDYVALGPIFETGSKRNPDPVVGLEELRRLCPLAMQPLVAIGGVTRENAATAIGAGADSVAVIGDLIPDHCSKNSLRLRTEEWRQLLKR